MTNIDHAAEVIESAIDHAEELDRPAQESAPVAAHALDRAGLLAPDVPDDQPIGVRVIDTTAIAAIDLDRATAEDLTDLVYVLMDIKTNGVADFYSAHAEGGAP